MKINKVVLLTTINILLLYFNIGILSVFIYIYIYFILVKEDKYFYLLLYSIPFSFTSILSLEFSKLPISYFMILSVINIVKYRKRTKKKNIVEFITLLYFSTYLIALIFSNKLFSSLTAAGTVLLPYFTFSILSNNIKKSKEVENFLVKSALGMGLGLIIQCFYYYYLNVELGRIDIYGLTRVAMGSIFSDYSLLSIYFSISAMTSFYLNQYKTTIFLIICSVLTTARAGIVAFIITIVFVAIYSLIYDCITVKTIKKKDIKIILLAFISLIIVLLYFYKIRNGSAILTLSGRENGYNLIYTKEFKSKILTGIGIGKGTYINFLNRNNISYIPIPHNQLLLEIFQKGLIGALIYLSYISVTIFSMRPKNVFSYNLMLFVASMTVPNIFESRFYFAYMFLFLQRDIKLKKLIEESF